MPCIVVIVICIFILCDHNRISNINAGIKNNRTNSIYSSPSFPFHKKMCFSSTKIHVSFGQMDLSPLENDGSRTVNRDLKRSSFEIDGEKLEWKFKREMRMRFNDLDALALSSLCRARDEFQRRDVKISTPLCLSTHYSARTANVKTK